MPVSAGCPAEIHRGQGELLYISRAASASSAWKACTNNAIDHKIEDEVLDFKVGTIIVATGFETYVR